tara:strand:- start:857 stop:1240 length:384 start_codon:yes stop_codon:yes gene_type:complete
MKMDGMRATVIQPSTYEWQQESACRKEDPSLFFTETGQTSAPAKAICAGCPVAFECLLDSLIHGDRFGIFGGLTERERREVKRYWAAAQEFDRSPDEALEVALVEYADRHENFRVNDYVVLPQRIFS